METTSRNRGKRGGKERGPSCHDLRFQDLGAQEATGVRDQSELTMLSPAVRHSVCLSVCLLVPLPTSTLPGPARPRLSDAPSLRYFPGLSTQTWEALSSISKSCLTYWSGPHLMLDEGQERQSGKRGMCNEEKEKRAGKTSTQSRAVGGKVSKSRGSARWEHTSGRLHSLAASLPTSPLPKQTESGNLAWECGVFLIN